MIIIIIVVIVIIGLIVEKAKSNNQTFDIKIIERNVEDKISINDKIKIDSWGWILAFLTFGYDGIDATGIVIIRNHR